MKKAAWDHLSDPYENKGFPQLMDLEGLKPIDA